MEIVHSYFRAERHTGYLLLVMAALAIGFVWASWRYAAPQPVFAGMRWPLAAAALLFIAFAIYLHYSTVAREQQLLSGSLPQLRAAELPRITQVLQSFVWLKRVWAGLAIATLIALLAVQVPFWQGVLLALLMLWVSFFAVDVFAHHRAQIYATALQALPQS
jgi:chromate transport protein ChrA